MFNFKNQLLLLVVFLTATTMLSSPTVFAKSTPWINVRAYGAKGNDNKEDTAQLQRAINAAKGRVIFIPAGVYITGKLTLPSNTTLTGVGFNSILRMKDGNNDDLLTNNDWGNGNSNIVIRDLSLEGNRSNNSVSPQYKAHGIDFEFVSLNSHRNRSC